MGIEHMSNIAHIEGAVVAAYADPDPGSRAAAASIAPDARAFTNHHDLVEAGVCEGVVIATPNFTHADLLTDLLPTDLHILVEKPLCTTVDDCRRVLAAADGRSAVTWVGLEYRYMPPVARLIKEVKTGTVGALKMVAIREHRFPFLPKVANWNRFNRNTGGTLVEKACHFFDLMNHIIADTPTRVMASGSHAVNHLDESYDGEVPDILDNAYVIVEYDRSGTRAMLDLCMFAEATLNQEEVVAVGDSGKVEALIPEMSVRIGRRGRHAIGQVEIHRVDDSHIPYRGYHHGSSYLEHLDFIAACRGGGAAQVGIEDGLLSVAMGVAAQRSIEGHRPVELSEVL